MQPTGTFANSYTGGNCTWYVASRIQVPSFMGNAKNWASGLASVGWRSGPPRRGAIAVSFGGWAGHVAVVEEVSGGLVRISEMNYAGLGVISTRWASPGEFVFMS